MQRFLLTISFGLFLIHSSAQNRTIDSLISSLKSQKVDSNIYKTSLLVAKAYADSAYDKSLIYFKRALDVAEKSRDRKKVAHIFHQIGSMYQRKGEFSQALVNYNNALEIHKFLKNKRGIGQLLNDIGLIYKTWGKYDNALENYFNALKLFDEIGDDVNCAMASNNIGQIYYYRSEFEKSIEYFKKYLEVNKKNNAPRAVAGAANNIASAYMEIGKLDDALSFFVRSMRIYDSLKIKIGVAIIKDNIGSLFLRKKQYNDALLYNSEALKIFEEIGSQPRICASLLNVGLAYSKLNQPEIAINYLNRSLNIALSIKQKETQKEVYEALSEVYFQTKQYEKSLLDYKLYVQIKDSLLNAETIGKIESVQAEYESQKKEKELAEINHKLHNQKILAIISAGLFILFLFLMALIARENLHKKKIISSSESKTKNLYGIIHKAKLYLLSNQNNRLDLSTYFEKSWQVKSREDNPVSILSSIKDSYVLIALVSKGSLTDNMDIVELSVFDFLNTFSGLSESQSIKEQYYNFLLKESVWQKISDDNMLMNIDFWCFNKETHQHKYYGMLNAFYVNKDQKLFNLGDHSSGWQKVDKGDRFYFYTTTHLNVFNQNEQDLFQNTLSKTIANTLNIAFEEQKEIFRNSLELIDAGNESRFDITLVALMV